MTKVVGELARRGLISLVRVPAAWVPTLVFPLFFMAVMTGLYGAITDIPGFPTDSIYNWIVPFMVLQGAAFSGVGAGFATGQDIENGFIDRLLSAPVPRIALTLGTIAYAAVRALGVAFIVFLAGIALGARLTNPAALVLLLVAVVGTSVIASCWSLGLIYRVKDQRISPLYMIGIFVTIFVSTAQVPLAVMTGWLHSVARVNPFTNILRMARQAFLDTGVTWRPPGAVCSPWPSASCCSAPSPIEASPVTRHKVRLHG